MIFWICIILYYLIKNKHLNSLMHNQTSKKIFIIEKSRLFIIYIYLIVKRTTQCPILDCREFFPNRFSLNNHRKTHVSVHKN